MSVHKAALGRVTADRVRGRIIAADRARILGVAGGDGSVQLAAGLAADKGLPLLVIPAGTFNHFATDLGVRSAEEAVDALRAGDSVLVDLATAGPLPRNSAGVSGERALDMFRALITRLAAPAAGARRRNHRRRDRGNRGRAATTPPWPGSS